MYARCADSPALREDLAGRGREQVRSFSWQQTAAGYLDLLAPARRPFAGTHAVPSGRRPASPSIVATRGRPEIASATVRHLLATQTLKPDAMIVSCVDIDRCRRPGGARRRDDPGHGPAGLAAQRNTALANLSPETEIVAFFDDDFVADKDWLAAAAQTFRDEADVVGFTGRVLADGVTGPGIGFEEALRIVATAPRSNWAWIEPYSPYGCNMAFRASAIGESRFDERLVLYGWLEDRDFGAALAKRGGRFVKCADAFGVHMGVKGGRVSGERFGYSQVDQPALHAAQGNDDRGAGGRPPVPESLQQFRAGGAAGALHRPARAPQGQSARSCRRIPRPARAGARGAPAAGPVEIQPAEGKNEMMHKGPTPGRGLSSRIWPIDDHPAQTADEGPVALLRAIIAVALRHKFKLILWTAICIGVAALYARSVPPTYVATASLLLEPRRQALTSAREVTAPPTLDLNRADSELQIIRSERLLAAVFKSLALENHAELQPQPPGMVRQLLTGARRPRDRTADRGRRPALVGGRPDRR